MNFTKTNSKTTVHLDVNKIPQKYFQIGFLEL